jgi:glycosyltransferase involved in cell wall biosynthesis
MSTPLVSIVMPAYNRARLIRESIQSALEQTLSDLELIVLDDGSSDGTPAVVRRISDPRIRLFELERSGHLSRLRNLGIERARGRLVAFLDSDDLWQPDKLQRQAEALDRHPQAGWSLCGYEVFDENGVQKRRLYEQNLQPQSEEAVGSIFPDLIRTQTVIYTSTVLARRRALQETGPLDESLKTSDFEFLTRLAYRFPVALLRLALARIRKHPGNTSLQLEEEGLQEAICAVERFRQRGKLPQADYRQTLSRLRFNLGRLYQRQGDHSAAEREFRQSRELDQAP